MNTELMEQTQKHINSDGALSVLIKAAHRLAVENMDHEDWIEVLTDPGVTIDKKDVPMIELPFSELIPVSKYTCSCQSANLSLSGNFELCDVCRMEEENDLLRDAE